VLNEPYKLFLKPLKVWLVNWTVEAICRRERFDTLMDRVSLALTCLSAE